MTAKDAREDDDAELEHCPICGKKLEEGEHYWANPPASHSYHTDKRGIARVWEHRDGLDVIPPTEPFGENTVGGHLYG